MRSFLIFSFLFLTSCATDRHDAKSSDLYLQLGRTQLQKGNSPQALGTLLKAEKLDPNNVEVQNYLGMTYFLMKQNKHALKHFQKSLELSPAFSEGRNNMARVLIETGRYAEARKELQRVLADLTYLQQPLALTNMGLLLVRETNYKSALPYLQKAIKLDKSNCLTYSLYARSLYELNNLRAALPAFEAALPLCKRVQFDEAHYYAALAYYKSGDRSRGIGLMNETILLYPDGNYSEKAKATLELMRYNRL